MRRKSSVGKSATQDIRSSTVGGVSGGTGLIAIAHAVGVSTALGQVLLYVAPAGTFLISSGLYYLEAQGSRYLQRRAVKKARDTLAEQLDNPRTSDEHKKKIRKMLEQLEESWASAEVDRVTLAFALEPDVEQGA
jgi:hypothetical protein